MIHKENQPYIRLGNTKTHHTNSRHSSITKHTHPQNTPHNLPIKITDCIHRTQNQPLHQFESKTQNEFYHNSTSAKQNEKQMSNTMSQFKAPQTLRVASPSPCIMSVIKGLPDDPRELQRKIKVLEARVRELHQERQNQRIKMDEQMRKINLEREILHKNLEETEFIKNMEIQHLRKQITAMNELRRPQNLMVNSHSRLSMKNSILIGNQQTGEDETQEIKQIQTTNQQLQRELHKLTGYENLKKVEEKNQFIVVEYEDKIKALQQRIYELEQNQEAVIQMKEAESKQYIQTIRNLEMANNKCMEERNTWKQELEEQNERLRTELRVSTQVGGQNCQKCKQLIKSLVRLNSKMI